MASEIRMWTTSFSPHRLAPLSLVVEAECSSRRSDEDRIAKPQNLRNEMTNDD
jgi:hypothetical protein